MDPSPERRSDAEDLLPIVRAKEANRLLLRSRPNVVGLDVGFRTRQGQITQERVIKVYVSRKIDRSFLGEEQLIPSTVSIDGREVGVDVEQRPIPQSSVNFTLRDRPLRGGMSISTGIDDFPGTGTLGICVTLNDGFAYILSNNHVLAGTNRAPLGTPIIQPGAVDGGVYPDDTVGILTRFVRLDFGFTTIQLPNLPPVQVPNTNYVDAALALLLDREHTAPVRFFDGFNLGNRELHWIGYPRHLASGRWSVEQKGFLFGLRVCKMGRTTEFTTGTIISAFYDTMIDYNGRLAWFEDQIVILGDSRPFADSGDSGSLVVTFVTGPPQVFSLPPVIRGTDPIGLVFAALPQFNLAVANPLDAVLDELGIPQL